MFSWHMNTKTYGLLGLSDSPYNLKILVEWSIRKLKEHSNIARKRTNRETLSKTKRRGGTMGRVFFIEIDSWDPLTTLGIQTICLIWSAVDTATSYHFSVKVPTSSYLQSNLCRELGFWRQFIVTTPGVALALRLGVKGQAMKAPPSAILLTLMPTVWGPFVLYLFGYPMGIRLHIAFYGWSHHEHHSRDGVHGIDARPKMSPKKPVADDQGWWGWGYQVIPESYIVMLDSMPYSLIITLYFQIFQC